MSSAPYFAIIKSVSKAVNPTFETDTECATECVLYSNDYFMKRISSRCYYFYPIHSISQIRKIDPIC